MRSIHEPSNQQQRVQLLERADPNYMTKHVDIDVRMRGILVDWLQLVVMKFGLLSGE